MAEMDMGKIAQEAAEKIMNQVRHDTGISLKECYEKQISKKMEYRCGSEFCPSCKMGMSWVRYSGLRTCYCNYCGQKITR